jgi:predicted dienelactone hydrolase
MHAALDLLATTPPLGLQPDMGRVGIIGFSLGGYTALGLSGVRLTKAAFVDHCAADPAAVDCAWMVQAGVDFTTIDAARYDADHTDARIMATVAIDPALVSAIDKGPLATINHPFLLINLGDAGTIPGGSNAAEIAQILPDATYVTVPGARHFSFLSECSTLGRIVIAVSGEDNICSDSGLRDRAIIHDELRASIGGFLAQQFGITP